MEQKQLLALNLTELDYNQAVNLDGGHYEISMDRDSTIMFNDYIRGVFWGFVNEFSI